MLLDVPEHRPVRARGTPGGPVLVARIGEAVLGRHLRGQHLGVRRQGIGEGYDRRAGSGTRLRKLRARGIAHTDERKDRDLVRQRRPGSEEERQHDARARGPRQPTRRSKRSSSGDAPHPTLQPWVERPRLRRPWPLLGR